MAPRGSKHFRVQLQLYVRLTKKYVQNLVWSLSNTRNTNFQRHEVFVRWLVALLLCSENSLQRTCFIGDTSLRQTPFLGTKLTFSIEICFFITDTSLYQTPISRTNGVHYCKVPLCKVCKENTFLELQTKKSRRKIQNERFPIF